MVINSSVPFCGHLMKAILGETLLHSFNPTDSATNHLRGKLCLWIKKSEFIFIQYLIFAMTFGSIVDTV